MDSRQVIVPQLFVDSLKIPACLSQPTSNWRQSSTVNLDVQRGRPMAELHLEFPKSF
jgi:hypothetical protein